MLSVNEELGFTRVVDESAWRKDLPRGASSA